MESTMHVKTHSVRRGGLLLTAAALFTTLTAVSVAAQQVRAQLVASGFTQPVAFVQDPSDPTVQLVVQQDGRVRVLKDFVVQGTDYLDLRSQVRNEGERGLLGLAFAPDYATSGRVFVNFINNDGDTVIARFRRAADDPLRADPQSRFDFRWPDGRRVIEQPFSNHNGGNLVFGPDGHLYLGMGDGGSGNDPMHNAQNPRSLLGKMLRLDVSVPDGDPEGYDVPPSNPFAGRSDVLGEIWAFGLRNPWRWSFDDPARGGTGALVIGDVGQAAFEEVDYEPAGRGGRNYGWRNREGAHPNVGSLPPFSQPLVDPIFEYPRGQGASITGGYVYRGALLGTAARGRYFFADFIQSRVWSIALTITPISGEATAGNLVEHTGDLGPAADNPSSFGLDAAGELYVVTYGGAIYRLFSDNPAPPGPAPPEPNPPNGPNPTPGAGRRRPPDAPVIGRAVPRGPSPPDGTTSAAASARAGDAGDVASADWPFVVVHHDALGELALAEIDLDGDGVSDRVWRWTAGDTVMLWVLIEGRIPNR
jgi:glucose/arabinose dehydrogenase